MRNVLDEKIKQGDKDVRRVISQLVDVADRVERNGPIHVSVAVFSRLLSGFEANVRAFTGLMTGQQVDPTKRPTFCFEQLMKTGAAKSQQFDLMYAEIQRLRDMVERQNQVITSLEYRRLLENLPNKGHYDKVLRLTLPKDKTATKYWKATWKDLVEQETRLMIQSTSAQPAAATTAKTKRPLSDLFESDFQYWLLKNPNSKASSVPEQDFRAWSAYNGGEKLYSELSSTIHQYDGSSGEPYDFKLTNWSRSDRLILAALRPDKAYIITNSDGVWDVKWDKERKRQALP